jgi:hypothetical protein
VTDSTADLLTEALDRFGAVWRVTGSGDFADRIEAHLADLAAGNREAPSNGTSTSAEAAAEIKLKTGGLRHRILDHLAASPHPLTDWQLQQQLHIGASTERPRRGELVKAGLVHAVDMKGESETGGRAKRWGVSLAGYRALDALGKL